MPKMDHTSVITVKQTTVATKSGYLNVTFCALMVYWCKGNTCMLESALSCGNYYVDVSFSYTIVTCRHSFLYLHYSQVCDRRKRCHHYLRLPVHLSVSSAELLLLPQG